MIYSIYMDGVSIYEASDTRELISPSVDIEWNSAGTLEFTMPVTHEYYNLPKPLLSNVEVFEIVNGKENSIWYGRVIKITNDFQNNKVIECEGALAFLNDSIQRPYEYTDPLFTNVDFFKILIDNHNEQVADDRKMYVRDITVDIKYVYRKIDYDTTLDAINKMCIEANGGYINIEHVDNINYIDWLKEPYEVGTQPIMYGLNITNLNQVFDCTDIKTCIIPIGKEDENTKIKATCKTANRGYDYIESEELIELYGRISVVVEFSDLEKAEDLVIAAKTWLENNQFDPFSIDVDAAELSYIYPEYDALKIGQLVHVTSTPHVIDKTLPIIKMHLNLDSPAKSISIGSVKKKSLTEITKDS